VVTALSPVRLSVSLSVRPSIVDQFKTVQGRIMKLLPYGSLIPQKLEGWGYRQPEILTGSRQAGTPSEGGWGKQAIF